jgi:hypothetical protein
MVVGFNHNIKYRGQIYHVQTEDSGTESPRITTHLFLGGNIVASRRTSYADILGADNLVEVVRTLMEEQHKEMLRNLVNGVYDPGPGRPGGEARSVPAGPAPRPPPAQGGPAAPGPATAGAPGPARETAPALRDPLFGEDLISERSLDEVILAYLSGEPRERKP